MSLSAVYFSYLVFATSLVAGQQPYSTKLETELRDYLFTDYDALQRPNQTVGTKVTLNLLTVNSLDIKEQQLSISGYFYMLWSDSRLVWASNTTYGNIRFLFSNENYMWRPAIIVENSVSDMSVISDENTLMRINSDGSAVWTPGGIYETHCDCDVTYYPLDTQTCSVVLSTWAYTANEISLSLGSPVVDTTYFSENGEWQLLSVSGQETSTTRESQSFSRLKFTLTLRRRPLFHILNTILPVAVMATLIVMVFKLPPESGERIGMSLTALLAYAVYLTLIADNIPKTSVSASVLSTYLAIIFCLSALTVILTIVVLDLYFNIEGDDVPAWLNRITHHVMVKFSCWKGITCCSGRNRVTPNDEDKGLSSSRMILKLNVSDVAKLRGKEAANESPEKKSKLSLDTTFSDDNTIPEYSWKEIALIMDKCLLYIFMILVFLATTITFIILGANY
ncbi:hypothetical protein CHS0354_001692 [Potamilus streckersoni]|uniref:Uncharacterized protein n=1 Tax=Potamilus streckersoni TaxID=2493646 RepID=A0AAE0VM39_9BIVA|nr:hypothetical protein CHS0354_001692 [Potamilus streckersoni]